MGVMNGVRQWIFQRVSNALFVLFGIVLLKLLLTTEFSYEAVTALVNNSTFQIYALITLVFACLNSVLAGWQIEGDYSKKFGIPSKLITTVVAVVSAGYLYYGIKLLV
ncbi:succinate dehydrogenase, hydrophobic membrane anchor protein [Porticoccaceae bacterium LTM1]|nr:succinate dehydrogenase, hydrophobic membrane anchor protein [Porticoccaceae bacterium LTM1]